MRANEGVNVWSQNRSEISGSGRVRMLGEIPASTLTLVKRIPLASESFRHRCSVSPGSL